MGSWTDQEGFVTGSAYDATTHAFTTSWFQCFDLWLTNGVNEITLRMIDRAGNATVTNLTYTQEAAATGRSVRQ